MITAMLRKRMSVATTMAVSCSGWFGMRRLSPSPPPPIMNHFSLESGAKPPDPGLPDPAKGGKAVRRPRTVSEPKSERSKVALALLLVGGEIIPTTSQGSLKTTLFILKENYIAPIYKKNLLHSSSMDLSRVAVLHL